MIPEGGLVPQCPTIFVNGTELQCGCGLTELLTLFQNLINFSIYLAIMILTLVIVYIGFLLVTQGSNPTVRGKAKRIAQSAIIGFVIAISAFTIVDLVMRTFAQDSDWAGILGTDSGACVDPQAVRVGSGGGSQNVVVGSGGSGDNSHAEALAQLEAAGIGISSTSGSCSDRNDSTCTSLEGMRQSTIDQVILLREACDCSITVTGGTETGHTSGIYSHGRGYKIDLRLYSDLTKFIIDNLNRAGSRGSDPRYRDGCGNEYVREGDHWDIQVTNGACSDLTDVGGN